MPPKKKSAKKKADAKAAPENEETIEMGLEDKLLKAHLEISSLQHELGKHTAVVALGQQQMKNDLNARLRGQLQEQRQRIEQLEEMLDIKTQDRIELTLDMSRQYKTMQSEMISKVNALEKQVLDLKTKLAQVQTAYGEARRLHENILTEKDALLEEQNMKMTYMTNEFETMLNETLGRMSRKLEIASQRWKDNDQVALSETNVKRLEDFQLTRIALSKIELFDGLVSGDRASLARSITLVESLREDHRLESQQLLSLILRREHGSAPPQPRTGADTAFPSGFRIGLSGAPGVGKSSFIETFGMFLISKGHKVAVLAVDPSSSRTGGSLLGDKTRMTELSRHDDAYVRPSPSSGSLGGVARNTNEAILLCSAAGYDIILVETVGVGQSETMVADMVDMFTLLVAPGAGDELQGMKKGIVELSDLILVNKADGELAGPARLAQIEYTSALKFIMPMTEGWYPKVLPVSSHQREGIDKAWETMKEYYGLLAERNELAAKRGAQQKKWMWRQITDELHWRLRTDPNVKGMVPEFERLVDNGEITSGQAAEEILDAFISGQSLRGSAAQKNPSVPAA